MDKVKLAGTPFRIGGNIPKVGDVAPDVTVVNRDLQEVSVYDEEGKVRVLIGVPSLDTGVCAKQTREFNLRLKGLKVLAWVVSKDLPFAMKRFCEGEGIKEVHPVSDYRYNDFCSEYGVELLEGPMKGLAARSLFVIDAQNIVRYVEICQDIINEPDYDAAMEAVQKLLK